MTNLSNRINAFPIHRVESAGGTVCFRETGAGEPMVLLHGVGSSSASWVDFMAEAGALLPGRRLLAWDAPGYSESAPLPQTVPSAADYAAALKAMLDSLGMKNIFLVGHSLGALIAGAFAAANPGRVRALILLDPAGGYGASTPEARQGMIAGRLRMLAQLGAKGMADQRGAVLLSPKATPEAIDLVKWSMGRVDPKGYEQAVRMLADGRLAEDVARFSANNAAPVLVMCGSEDTVTPEEGCRGIAAACRGAEYRSLAGLGHASYVESPRLVASEIAGFLDQSMVAQQQQ
ncbi:MAG: alpha/beta hydrolase [Betaproteobacteria bacterium]|nr:alpha/beta hydrolase [Betaproteobacteria bacterium]